MTNRQYRLAIQKGLIDSSLPSVREQAVDRLSNLYESEEEADEAFESLMDFYEDNYPETYLHRRGAIQQAIESMKDISVQIAFPEQEIDWETHPDNLGHRDFPGCFRCHDGKHLSSTGEAIRLECNVCHSIPVVSDNTSLVTEIELVRGPEPPSHTHTSWMTLHGKSIDSSCAACHEPADPTVDYTELEGKPPPDGSFCGNTACHGPDWTFTGFDAPELEPYLAQQLYILQNTSPYLLEGVERTYEDTFQFVFEGRCSFCHSGSEPDAGLDMTSYESLLAGGRSGPVFIPGDPAGSLIIQRQSGARDHFGQVLDDELTALEAWIEAGAPED